MATIHAAYKKMSHSCQDKGLRSLDCNILHEVGCQRLCMLLKLILAITVLLKKTVLTLPIPTVPIKSAKRLSQNVHFCTKHPLRDFSYTWFLCTDRERQCTSHKACRHCVMILLPD